MPFLIRKGIFIYMALTVFMFYHWFALCGFIMSDFREC